MRKFTLLTLLLFFLSSMGLYAQKTVSGTVTNADDGSAIPGVSVLIKGTQKGTVSDLDGKYKLEVPDDKTVLVFSFVGKETQEITVGSQTTIDVALKTTAIELQGTVITALGISREKKSLGYSTQKVSGEEVSTVKTDNFVNTMSGKVAGLQVRQSNNMGGSTNIIIRGSSSLTGNNQPLFVVDGVPISNANTNSSYQRRGGMGYDYGNAASDIDPDDIESINVLKGAAATALYGSRAANGVIIITTKKGAKAQTGKSYLGVTLNLSATMGIVDKSTFIKYQTEYGGGYGPYYSGGDHPGLFEYDFDGDGKDDLVVPTTEDASFGEKFDPNLMVYQWNAFDPESPNYMKKTPWVNAANGPITFFENAWTFKNGVSIEGGNQSSSFRLGYSRLDQSGIMPNSHLTRDNFNLNTSWDMNDKWSTSATINYVKTQGLGRNSTGYSDNIMTSFRQWFQTNVDIQEQKDMYELTGRNVTWNYHSQKGLYPEYWDNPYWTRYENYETDGRSRIFGNAMIQYKPIKNLSFTGRITTDYYSEIQEERRAVGSISAPFGIGYPDVQSGYSRYNRTFQETNYDFLARYNGQINDDNTLMALFGTNYRRTDVNSIYASTNGGLVVPDLYSLSNSLNPTLTPHEGAQEIGVFGIFGQVSWGFKHMVYIDATLRRDQSSTLPAENSAYYYPSIAANFIFSEVVKADWLSFGKFRVNYAEVGNDAPFASIYDTYSKPSPFGNVTLFSIPSTKNNTNLKPERTKSLEAGLEMMFANNRVGFDFAVYKNNTVDQILPVSVSTATGYSSKYVNSGEIENKGIELAISGTPVKSKSFSWDVILNWAKNVNKVISLYEGVDNLQLGRFQGGISINARVGEPYGVIQGTDFVYDDATGKKVINSTGYHDGYYKISSTSDNVIGNINPDWNAGLTNRFNYKNWSFSFLLDYQHGGDIFSLDQWYGQGTGLYANTVFTNDLGNPVRNKLSEGGGVILDGVKEDGTPNDIRVRGDNYALFGWARNPNSMFVYDASYLKLRQLVLTYKLPRKFVEGTFIKGASFSFVGSNLWIIFKNLPDADPEAGLGSGNLQGWQSGVLPTTRNFGLNINLQF
jgi:TonB-linked SusC/RagA family outer membrane protein